MGTNSEEMNNELDEERGIVTKVLEQIFDSSRMLKAGPLVPIILGHILSEYLASTIIGVTNLHSPGSEDIMFGTGITQERRRQTPD